MSQGIENRLRLILKNNIEIPNPVDQIKSDDNLFDVGLNSISAIKLIVIVEKEFEVEFDDEDLMADRMNTIGKMATVLKDKYKIKDSGL